jgi:voltage-gated potassium channel
LAGSILDGVIVFLIAINVLLVVVETFRGFSATVLSVFRYAETVSVIIFTAEYLLRIWTADYIFQDKKPSVSRLKYAFSFMAIIDLLAILPFYIPFLLPIDLRVLRMVRLLRILRILKISRYTDALSTIGNVIRRKSAQLISSLLVVLILMVMASVVMYYAEYDAQPTIFRNAFSGLWWAIATLTTVGYGDIFPITALGKILSAVIALLGIGFVAVPTGIISAGFVEYIDEPESATYCPHCGKKL